jgi:hypothetical protein
MLDVVMEKSSESKFIFYEKLEIHMRSLVAWYSAIGLVSKKFSFQQIQKNTTLQVCEIILNESAKN